jgi:hypothetical protein
MSSSASTSPLERSNSLTIRWLTKAYRRAPRDARQANEQPFLSYIRDRSSHRHDMATCLRSAMRARRSGTATASCARVQELRAEDPHIAGVEGLAFNRFVTDSHRNAKAGEAACDFLLHDGRACDALGGGLPARRAGGPEAWDDRALNDMTRPRASQLRAFLYSLRGPWARKRVGRREAARKCLPRRSESLDTNRPVTIRIARAW